MDDTPSIRLIAPPPPSIWRSKGWWLFLIGSAAAIVGGGYVFVKTRESESQVLHRMLNGNGTGFGAAGRRFEVFTGTFQDRRRNPIGTLFQLKIDGVDIREMDPAELVHALDAAESAVAGWGPRHPAWHVQQTLGFIKAARDPQQWGSVYNEPEIARQAARRGLVMATIPPAIWFGLVGLYLLPRGVLWTISHFRAKPLPPEACQRCGYNLAHHEPDHGMVTCPECGHAQVMP